MPLVRSADSRVRRTDTAANRNHYIPCGRNFIGRVHALRVVAEMVRTRATLLSDDDGAGRGRSRGSPGRERGAAGRRRGWRVG